jgi:hypothetical protein
VDLLQFSNGLALRSGYNEIAALEQALHERDIEFEDGSSESLGALVQRAARQRRRSWFPSTSAEELTVAGAGFISRPVF